MRALLFPVVVCLTMGAMFMGDSQGFWGLLKAPKKHGQGLPTCPLTWSPCLPHCGEKEEEEFPGRTCRLAWGPQHAVPEGPPEELWADASTLGGQWCC